MINLCQLAMAAAALLLPFTSHAADNLSGPVTVQSVPPATCDNGDPLSVPSMAGAGGFTHCVLNADFTKVDGAFNDTAKFIDGCGARGNRIFQAYYAYSGLQVPCNRIKIEQDNGIQVLHLQYLHGDSAASGVGALPLEFAYPTLHHGGAVQAGWPQPAGPGAESLPQTIYAEITFRTTVSSLNQAHPPPNFIDFPISWWMMNGNNNPFVPQGIEIDYIEIRSDTNVGNGWNGTTGMIEWGCANGKCPRPNQPISSFVDYTQYHKFGILVTSDLKTNMAKCLFMDDLLQGCQHITPSDPIAYRTDRPIFLNFVVLWLGTFGRHIIETVNPVDVYVKNITIWDCPTYLTTNCTGSKWLDNRSGLTYWSAEEKGSGTAQKQRGKLRDKKLTVHSP
jgi:hypothetical protein